MSGGKTVFVGGLDTTVSLETIWSSFIPFGDIVGIVPSADSPGGFEHRGIFFVEYETAADAKAAVDNMNGSEINGKPINVKIALLSHIKRGPIPEETLEPSM